jgi:hypothetical protein
VEALAVLIEGWRATRRPSDADTGSEPRAA